MGLKNKIRTLGLGFQLRGYNLGLMDWIGPGSWDLILKLGLAPKSGDLGLKA